MGSGMLIDATKKKQGAEWRPSEWQQKEDIVQAAAFNKAFVFSPLLSPRLNWRGAISGVNWLSNLDLALLNA